MCTDPGGVANATYTLNGLTVGSTTNYSCVAGFQYETGYLTRTCQPNGIWDGVPPVCVITPTTMCNDPGGVANATYTVSGLNVGSTAKYNCVSVYLYEAGYMTRTCQSNGIWDGVPSVCCVIQCAEPENVFNATYTKSGLYPGNTAIYACITGSTQIAGHSSRTCHVNGSWDGTPIVCSGSGSCELHPVSYTEQQLQNRIDQLKQELTIEPKTTNAYQRTLLSVRDDRPSATCIGSVGILVLVTVMCAIVIPDVLNLFRYLQRRRQTLG